MSQVSNIFKSLGEWHFQASEKRIPRMTERCLLLAVLSSCDTRVLNKMYQPMYILAQLKAR